MVADTERYRRGVQVDSREWEAPEGFMAAGSHGWGYFEDLQGRRFRNHGADSTACETLVALLTTHAYTAP